MTRIRLLGGPLALATVLLLALGLAACGDDSSDGSATADQGQADTRSEGDGGDAETEVRATFQALQDAFSERDAEKVCDQLSPQAQKQTGIDGAPDTPTCVGVAKALFDQWGENIRRNAKIVRLRIDGDRALAVITAGETLELPRPFVKTDDGWKMDESLIPQPN
ncbi:MAG: hypothetical protein WEB79_04205 [Thermoleophilaceae bacterium]